MYVQLMYTLWFYVLCSFNIAVSKIFIALHLTVLVLLTINSIWSYSTILCQPELTWVRGIHHLSARLFYCFPCDSLFPKFSGFPAFHPHPTCFPPSPNPNWNALSLMPQIFWLKMTFQADYSSQTPLTPPSLKHLFPFALVPFSNLIITVQPPSLCMYPWYPPIL